MSSKMKKLSMCRICLVENVGMLVVDNKKLHEVYEKLTDIPFVTEDSRPIRTCFGCLNELKQSYQLLKKCLEADERFAQMMHKDYETNPSINRDRNEPYSGFIKTPIDQMIIVEVCQAKSIAIKEELPDVCEELDDIVEAKEEYQRDELNAENRGDSCLLDTDIEAQRSESYSKKFVQFVEVKIEVEEEDVSKKIQEAEEMIRATVAKNPKLEPSTPEQDNEIRTEHPEKQKSDSKVIRPSQKLMQETETHFKEGYKCNQPPKIRKQRTRSQIVKKQYKCDVCHTNFKQKIHLTNHIRIHTGEKPFECEICQRSFNRNTVLKKHMRIHTGEKPYKCDICERTFTRNDSLKKHTRIHTGEKPFQCGLCQRSFNQKIHLKDHSRVVHTGEKPYKCDICEKSFGQKKNLTNHMRIHVVK